MYEKHNFNDLCQLKGQINRMWYILPIFKIQIFNTPFIFNGL